MKASELQPNILVFYLNTRTGQACVEIGGRIFELVVGDDITDELHVLAELEPIAVHDPSSVDEDLDTLRIENLEDEFEED